MAKKHNYLKRLSLSEVMLQCAKCGLSVMYITGVSHYPTNSSVAICYITFARRHLHAYTQTHRYTHTPNMCVNSLFFSLGLRQQHHPPLSFLAQLTHILVAVCVRTCIHSFVALIQARLFFFWTVCVCVLYVISVKGQTDCFFA